MKRIKKQSNRIVQIGLSLAMMVSLSACATSSVVKMTEAAPITYKIGQGGAKYASLSLPKTSRPSLPRSVPSVQSNPIPYTPPTAVPTGPSFNPSDVDTRLYSHQRVGKRYSIKGKSYTPKHNPSYDNVGIASWYGEKFHGRKTATGEIYNMNDLTAAHKTIALPPVMQEAVPVMPTPQPEIFENIVEAPSFNEPLYAKPQSATPIVPQDYFDVPQSQISDVPSFDPIAPKAPVPAPMAETAPEDDGQVTLTIKGPIHIARSDGTIGKPRLIRGGNRTTYRTVK